MRIAVVTGASYGLGKAISEILLGNNFKVYGVSRTKPAISNENFVWIDTDLSKQEGMVKIGSKIKESKIDLLINNAGTAILGNAIDFSDQGFEETFALNFRAPIKMVSELFSKIKAGLIINISSISDRLAEKTYGMYCASKAALNIYFDALGLENPQLKIFHLLPSSIDTPLQHKLNDDDKDFYWGQTMTSEQVAESVKYLIDSKDKLASGSKIIVINNELIEDIEDPEKLYYYNVDTAEFKKIK